MATLTKKDLLEAIEDMPMDAPVKAVIRLKENRGVVVNSLVVSKENGMIILRKYNNMLTEKDYCDKDLSDALKESGFPTKMTFIGEQATIEIPINSGQISLYEAQKWLREKKDAHIVVNPTKGKYYCTILLKGKTPELLTHESIVVRYFDSYEEALLEGVREVVKILKGE